MNASEITLDDVAGAYATTGLTPGTGHTNPGISGRCCALGALAVVAGLDPRFGMYRIGRDLGLEGADSFAYGFDSGLAGRLRLAPGGPARRNGYRIGSALRGWKP